MGKVQEGVRREGVRKDIIYTCGRTRAQKKTLQRDIFRDIWAARRHINGIFLLNIWASFSEYFRLGLTVTVNRARGSVPGPDPGETEDKGTKGGKE